MGSTDGSGAVEVGSGAEREAARLRGVLAKHEEAAGKLQAQLLELQSQWQAQQQALQDARARLARRDTDVASSPQAGAAQLPDGAVTRLQALEEAQGRWEGELAAVKREAAEQARRQWEGRLVLVQREAEQEAAAAVRRRTQELERDREQAVGHLRQQLEQQAQVRFGRWAHRHNMQCLHQRSSTAAVALSASCMCIVHGGRGSAPR